MTHIFYFFTALAILFEIASIRHPRKVLDFIQKIRTTPPDDLDGKESSVGFLLALYSVFLFVGIMTSQWICFLTVQILGMIPKRYAWLRFILAIPKLLILIFILVNKYHLHIDVFQFLRNYWHF